MLLFGREEKAKKRYIKGTHRTRSPKETLASYLPLAERCGITRLANITGLDYIGVPVYSAIRPLSRNLSVAQGKGPDPDAAKASALMEALERWHAEHTDLPLRYESFRALSRSENVLDPAPIPPMGTAQFDPDRPMLFARGWELFQDEPTWVPFDLVHMNFIEPAAPAAIYAPNSNGLASGNCRLEAAVHGLCELIERDACSLWFLDPRDGSDKRSQIDLCTIEDENRALLDQIAAAGLLLGVYESTSDIGIPCYQAILFDPPQSVRAMGYFWGFGCHLSPIVAVSRAVTEAVQCRLTEITGAREDILPADYHLNRSDAELAEMQEMLSDPPPTRSMKDAVSLATDSFEGDFEVVRQALRNAGIEHGALVDLTKPELGLPVVKAVVPELEGFFHGKDRPLGPRGRRQQDLLVVEESQ